MIEEGRVYETDICLHSCCACKAPIPEQRTGTAYMFQGGFSAEKAVEQAVCMGVTSELIHNQLKNVQCISGLSQAMPLS